ncbi:MAG: glycosyltransferase family 4 protein, partial [Candidatus Aenigmatarchaeota archaeon]
MNKIRVALCTELFYPLYGGVERRVYEMAERMHKFGADVIVLTSTSDYEGVLERSRVKQVSRCTLTIPPNRSLAFCIQYWFNTFRALMKEDYDVIDANGHLAILPAAIASFLRRKPMVATIHDLYLGQWKQMYTSRKSVFGLFMEMLTGLAAKQSNTVLTLNTSLKKRISRVFGISSSKIRIQRSGIDVEYIDKIKSGRKKKNLVIYVGRLVPQKNVSMLLRAFALIKDENIELCVVGDGEELESLKQLSIDLDISKKIVFTGKLRDYDDVLRKIKESTVLVLPSVRESFGIVPMEAMICYTPVISTHTEGPSDYIENGINSFLVDSEA